MNAHIIKALLNAKKVKFNEYVNGSVEIPSIWALNGIHDWIDNRIRYEYFMMECHENATIQKPTPLETGGKTE